MIIFGSEKFKEVIVHLTLNAGFANKREKNNVLIDISHFRPYIPENGVDLKKISFTLFNSILEPRHSSNIRENAPYSKYLQTKFLQIFRIWYGTIKLRKFAKN